MPYQVTTTPIDGVLVLQPKVFGDARGFFFESFKVSDFEQGSRLERKIRARQP
jgi:dTDP-4-dehydrorhamnose 3,5-epimerase